MVHAMWAPVQGRFKDYINSPKFNLYQSLHTTVIGPEGKPIEVQVRTHEMHRRAEYGIAAHWGYKEGSSSQELAWMQRIADVDQDDDDPVAFLAALKLDLEQDEVYVFTPKGRVINLPVGSCPVDFGYSVHTEIGNACIGARVNGRLVPLTHVLKSGDTCEIFTSKVESASPSSDWLVFVVSPKARNKIKQWHSREKRDDLVEAGRELLENELRRQRLPVSQAMNSQHLELEIERRLFVDLEALLCAIGEGQVNAQDVASEVFAKFQDSSSEERLPESVLRSSSSTKINSVGIHVDGFDDVLVRLSKCCTPVPGDEIMGFITRGRGVSVHRTDCVNADSFVDEQSSRLIDVEWDGSTVGTIFRAGVEVLALDRSGLLRDVANALSEQHVNIVACSTHTGGDRVAKMHFEFELADPSHLNSVLRTIKRIEGVYDAYRAGAGRSLEDSAG